MSMKLSKARFCPLCGVEALERDWYRLTHTNKRGRRGLDPSNVNGKAPEFQCTACHAAFMLAPSLRYEQAISILSKERKRGVYEKTARKAEQPQVQATEI